MTATYAPPRPQLATAPAPQRRYLPGLDGLRALSIALVLFSHSRGTTAAPQLPTWIWHIGDTGNLGVRIFFVISGFLITTLLLREENTTGRIGLRHFYIRRAFRILPPLWAFLAAMLIMQQAGVVHFPTLQWLQAALFTANYPLVHGTDWRLGHLWSLAVEEQFYFILPAVLVFAPRNRRTAILTSAIVIAPCWRTLSAWIAMQHGGVITADPGTGFLSSMDALATGCLLAILRTDNALPRWYQKLATSRWMVLLPVALLLLNGITQIGWLFLLLVIPAMNFAAAMMIDLASRGMLSTWQRLLDSRAVRWIGVLSYSIYLWQQLFLDRFDQRWFTSFPLNLALAVAAATASYYLIERPSLKLRPV